MTVCPHQTPVTVADVAALMARWAPPSYAIDHDPIGLSVGRSDAAVRRVLVTLDVTNKALTRAQALGATLIVSHHPAIFTPLLCVTTSDVEGARALQAAEARIALFAAHTNADACVGGTADALGEALALTSPEHPCAPFMSEPNHPEGVGFGRRLCDQATTLGALCNRVATRLEAPFVRRLGPSDRKVETLVIWPGALSDDVIMAAVERGVDALVVGEAKHHILVALAERKVGVILIGHDVSEWPFVPKVTSLVKEAWPTLSVDAMARDEAWI